MKKSNLKEVKHGTFIPLTNVVEEASKKTFRFKRLAVFSAVAIAANIALAFQVVQLYEQATEKVTQVKEKLIGAFTRVEVRTEVVQPSDLPFSELAKLAADKHEIPVVMLDAVITAESGGGDFLYRFEPEKFKELRAKVKGSDDEVRMLASSHGVGHVMGFNALPRCGVHWSKLYDTQIGLDCAAKILRQNMDRHVKEDDKARQIWLALRDYNGSGKAAEAYATRVFAAIGRILIRKDSVLRP